jgi:glycosyltransferase involved in cell wall biosynthesis
MAAGIGANLSGKKVLLVVDAEFLHDARLRKQALTLVKSGCRVWALHNTKLKDKREKWHGIYLVGVPIKQFFVSCRVLQRLLDFMVFPIWAWLEFLWLHATKRFDLVIVANPPDHLLVLFNLTCKVLHTPIINDFHDPFPEMLAMHFPLPGFYGLGAVLERSALYTSDAAMTVNNACLQRMRIRHGKRAENIKVFYNAPLQSSFNPRQDKVKEIKKKMGADVLVVYIGALNYPFAVDHLVIAVSELRSLFEKKNAKLLVVGKGAMGEKLKRMVSNQRLCELVHLEGFVRPEDVPSYYEAADIVVVPMHNAPLTLIATPNKIFEAMLARKPIITVDKPGIREVASKGIVYYDAGDVKALADKLAYAITNLHKLELPVVPFTWESQETSFLRFVEYAMHNATR